MGRTAGRIKKFLGNLTGDREAEAKGQAEETTGHKQDHETVKAVEDEMQQARGEKHTGG